MHIDWIKITLLYLVFISTPALGTNITGEGLSDIFGAIGFFVFGLIVGLVGIATKQTLLAKVGVGLWVISLGFFLKFYIDNQKPADDRIEKNRDTTWNRHELLSIDYTSAETLNG